MKTKYKRRKEETARSDCEVLKGKYLRVASQRALLPVEITSEYFIVIGDHNHNGEIVHA